MASTLADKLLHRTPEAAGLYHRLVLAVGQGGTGKTIALRELAESQGWPRINVNLKLAEKLLELTQKQRAVRVAALLDDVVKESDSEVVLLDNVEMLFSKELSQDPLRLLQGLSRNRTVVAAWPGTYDGQALTYAEPGHPEFRKYSNPQAVVVPASTDPAQDTAAHREETA